MKQMTIRSNVLEAILSRIAAFLHIPPLAVRMFKMANELSGLDRKTIPTELVPLNTLQLARGLLNFTVMQNLDGWILPYWAVHQYDPENPGFVPRSHLGLSINVTARNWTAVGSPGCSIEPTVDPRGLVTPFRNGWSVDLWLKVNNRAVFPSRELRVGQGLVEGFPIVSTKWQAEGVELESLTYVSGDILVIRTTMRNATPALLDATLGIALRPFNPEGVSLLHEITFDPGSSTFIINGGEQLRLPSRPDFVCCSNYQEGDSARCFASSASHPQQQEASCPAGLASAVAAYVLHLDAKEEQTMVASVPLGSGRGTIKDPVEVVEEWRRLLATGTAIRTPDEKLNSMLTASLSTLLLLVDDDSITPGPWTYHQFWFRDAAVMLRALDAFGFHGQTRPIIRGFPARQTRAGYFRSQQGEWDSNGQALWTVWQHAVLSHDPTVAAALLPSLRSGITWIDRARRTGPEDAGKVWEGLLPAGLSAEHLGLADHYFWDDWWAMAGVQAFVRLADWLGIAAEAGHARILLDDFRQATERAIERVRAARNMNGIPAGPARRLDCGMIGNCAAWYPLQELPESDIRMKATLELLEDHYFLDGLFFQHFVHSGKNPYLTLQIAHAWLYAGDRTKFWQMLSDVVRHASPTMNYPEAIHPHTGGGVMGDGHHGWAAAEMVLALRDAFIQERWYPGRSRPDLVLLGGTPSSWYHSDAHFSISRAPVPGGMLDLKVHVLDDAVNITLSLQEAPGTFPELLVLRLPVVAINVRIGDEPFPDAIVKDGETIIQLPGVQDTLRISAGISR